MIKLCLNTRDELMMVDLSKIVYFQANGNYTEFMYLCGEKHLVSFGLSKMQELIALSWQSPAPSPYIRIGRSLIINTTYLREISLLRQRLTLGDCDGHNYPLKVSKPLLKKLKDVIVEARSGKKADASDTGEQPQ